MPRPVMTLLVLSFPLLCALISMRCMIGNVISYGILPLHEHPPHARRTVPLRFVRRIHDSPVQAVIGAVQGVAEIFDAM